MEREVPNLRVSIFFHKCNILNQLIVSEICRNIFEDVFTTLICLTMQKMLGFFWVELQR